MLFGGKDVTRVPPYRRNAAMTFESYALYPHMTVFENIAFGLRARKTPAGDIDAKVKKAAQMLAIAHLLERFPRQLSGGQRQGVAMARAAAFATKFIIMDEPTAALGVKESRRVLELIKDVRDRGIPIILISHNMPHVFEVADRIHVHRLGKRLCVVARTPAS